MISLYLLITNHYLLITKLKVSAIAAMSQNRVIGSDNEIPWYLQEDFRFFKRTTLNHHIIMGRKTFESIGKPLPKRTNIVVTKNPFFIASGVITANSIEKALSIASNNGETEAFIIGGGSIYEQSLPFLNKIYLTEVETEISGDTFFPKLDFNTWKASNIMSHKKDNKNDYNFIIKEYQRL